MFSTGDVAPEAIEDTPRDINNEPELINNMLHHQRFAKQSNKRTLMYYNSFWCLLGFGKMVKFAGETREVGWFNKDRVF